MINDDRPFLDPITDEIAAAVTDLRYEADGHAGRLRLLLQGYDLRGEALESLDSHLAGVEGERDAFVAETSRLRTSLARIRDECDRITNAGLGLITVHEVRRLMGES